jgi:energy-converting hydrogenase Eha subunit C
LAGAIVATAVSLWLLLPSARESNSARWLGTLLGIGALAAFIAAGRRLGGLGEEAVFLIVSLVAVISAAATIVSRSPVYAAIWFALSLAGVAGVLLVLGAQFLGVATIARLPPSPPSVSQAISRARSPTQCDRVPMAL